MAARRVCENVRIVHDPKRDFGINMAIDLTVCLVALGMVVALSVVALASRLSTSFYRVHKALDALDPCRRKSS